MSDVREVKVSAKHQQIYKELTELIMRHEPESNAKEVLALAANLVGKLVAMQDQTRMTSQEALQIVTLNMETGNQEALSVIEHTQGNA